MCWGFFVCVCFLVLCGLFGGGWWFYICEETYIITVLGLDFVRFKTQQNWSTMVNFLNFIALMADDSSACRFQLLVLNKQLWVSPWLLRCLYNNLEIPGKNGKETSKVVSELIYKFILCCSCSLLRLWAACYIYLELTALKILSL